MCARQQNLTDWNVNVKVLRCTHQLHLVCRPILESLRPVRGVDLMAGSTAGYMVEVVAEVS